MAVCVESKRHLEAGDTEGWTRMTVLLRAGSSESHSSWSKSEEAEEVPACLFMRQMEQQQEWGDPSRRPRLERSERCRLSLAWVIGRGGGTPRLKESPSLPQKTPAGNGKVSEAGNNAESLWLL